MGFGARLRSDGRGTRPSRGAGRGGGSQSAGEGPAGPLPAFQFLSLTSSAFPPPFSVSGLSAPLLRPRPRGGSFPTPDLRSRDAAGLPPRLGESEALAQPGFPGGPRSPWAPRPALRPHLHPGPPAPGARGGCVPGPCAPGGGGSASALHLGSHGERGLGAQDLAPGAAGPDPPPELQDQRGGRGPSLSNPLSLGPRGINLQSRFFPADRGRGGAGSPETEKAQPLVRPSWAWSRSAALPRASHPGSRASTAWCIRQPGCPISTLCPTGGGCSM